MYRTIIEIKEDTPRDTIAEIKELCVAAHKNRAGEVKIKPINDYTFAFEGEEKDYGCLTLANLDLNDSEKFTKSIKSWTWEDEEPSESCDILQSLAYKVVV